MFEGLIRRNDDLVQEVFSASRLIFQLGQCGLCKVGMEFPAVAKTRLEASLENRKGCIMRRPVIRPSPDMACLGRRL